MRTLIAILACGVCSSQALGDELRGSVVDVDGRPASGASVTAAVLFHSPPLRYSTTTDPQGQFRLELPKLEGDERYTLAVRWQGQGVDLTAGSDAHGKEVHLRGQSLPDLTVRLRPAGFLRGRLLRAEDEGPVAGARVYFETGEVLVTDEQGGFEISGLPLGDHVLIPAADDRVRQYVLFDTTHEPNAELEVRLPRGAVLEGRVTDERGRPIAGAYLTRTSSGSPLAMNGWDERVDDEGRFRYGGISAERWFYHFAAHAPGYYSQAISTDVDDPTATIHHDIKLRKKQAPPSNTSNAVNAKPGDTNSAQFPRRTVRGTVRDSEGKPLADAEVRWAAFLWDPSVKSVRTNKEGTYELRSVPDSKGAFLILADRHAPQFVPVEPSQTTVDAQLSAGVTIRGRVVGASKKPISGVWIAPQLHCLESGYCNPIWIPERSTHSDDEGRFELTAMPPLGVGYDFLKEGYTDLRGVSLKPGERGNEIQLVSGGALPGRVVDAAGEPVRNFNIRVEIPRERKPNEEVGGYYAGFDWYGVQFTRADGRFVLTGVPAGGLLRLVVSSPGRGVGIVDRAVTSPLDSLPEKDLEIRIEPFQSLNVTVVDSRGMPIPRALVALLEDEPNHEQFFNWGYSDLWGRRRHSDDAGIAHFAEPACQDGTVLVRADSFARQRTTWHGDSHELRIEMQPGATIRGKVLRGGEPLAEGTVRLQTEQQDHLHVDLEATRGEFEFTELPSGELAFSVSGAANQVLQTQRIKLQPGDDKTLNVKLKAD